MYTFSHLTFQEYLASCDIIARYIHNTNSIWNEIQPKLHDPHWREVILLLLGALNRYEHHNSVLIRRIYESDDKFEPVVHRHLLLAARALIDHVNVDTKLRNLIIDDMLVLVKSNEPARISALPLLVDMQSDRRVSQGLLTLVCNVRIDKKIRNAVVRRLVNLERNENAKELIFSIALDESIDVEIRISAMRALNQEFKVKELLLSFMNNKKLTYKVRTLAAQALYISSKDVSPKKFLLLIASDKKTEEIIRTMALDTLVTRENAKKWYKLLYAIAQDKSESISLRRHALEILGRDGVAHKLFFEMAKNSKLDVGVRTVAIEYFPKISMSKRLLVAMLSEEKQIKAVRKTIISKLENYIDDDDIRELLFSISNDKLTAIDVRIKAAQALGSDPEAISTLIALSRKANISIRVSVARYLVKLGRKDEAIELLLDVVNRGSPKFYPLSEALRQLSELGQTAKMKRQLVSIASNKGLNKSLRLTAMQILGNFGYAELGQKFLFPLVTSQKLDKSTKLTAFLVLHSIVSFSEWDFSLFVDLMWIKD